MAATLLHGVAVALAGTPLPRVSAGPSAPPVRECANQRLRRVRFARLLTLRSRTLPNVWTKIHAFVKCLDERAVQAAGRPDAAGMLLTEPTGSRAPRGSGSARRPGARPTWGSPASDLRAPTSGLAGRRARRARRAPGSDLRARRLRAPGSPGAGLRRAALGARRPRKGTHRPLLATFLCRSTWEDEKGVARPEFVAQAGATGRASTSGERGIGRRGVRRGGFGWLINPW